MGYHIKTAHIPKKFNQVALKYTVLVETRTKNRIRIINELRGGQVIHNATYTLIYFLLLCPE